MEKTAIFVMACGWS